jgi:dienelactone hydrolase
MLRTLLILTTFTASLMAHAEIKIDTVEYKDGDTTLEGLVSYDTKKSGKRPGVLVVHEWTGINNYTKMRLKKLAELGYTAFAADIYGKGVRPTDMKDAGTTAAIYKSNRPLFRRRVNLAFDQLKKHKTVDTTKTAAIGYCFGGTGVLELARSGADLRGVVSFHGGLSTPTPADAKNIKAKVLALHGADDKFVTAEEVSGFETEMRDGGVDWQLVKYSKAVHSFTNPDAGNNPASGMAYNAEADRRSWQEMQDFFNEVLR